jgi:hypothetical protein
LDISLPGSRLSPRVPQKLGEDLNMSMRSGILEEIWEGKEMIGFRWKTIAILVLLAIALGMDASLVPVVEATEPEEVYDMNDDVSWKDADSYRRLGSDYTMLMDVAVLWNNYDYAEADDLDYVDDTVDVSIYCIGARNGYTNSVELWVKTSGHDYESEGTQTCQYDYWNIETWEDVEIEESSGTYYRFQLYSGYVKFGPTSNYEPYSSVDDDAVVQIDPDGSAPDYYFMAGLTFYNVDSCSDSRTDCGTGRVKLHSEVSNHVLFYEDEDYLLTDEITAKAPVGPTAWGIYQIYAKCLEPQCAVQIKIVTSGGTEDLGQFSFSGDWAWHELVIDGIMVGTKFKLRIENYDPYSNPPDSHFIWTKVGVDW